MEAVPLWLPSVAGSRPHSSRAAFHQWPSRVCSLQPTHVCSNMDYPNLALVLLVLAETLKGNDVFWGSLSSSSSTPFIFYSHYPPLPPQKSLLLLTLVSVCASCWHITSTKKARPAGMVSYSPSIMNFHQFPSPFLQCGMLSRFFLQNKQKILYIDLDLILFLPLVISSFSHFYIYLFFTSSRHSLAASSYLRITKTCSAYWIDF